MYSKMFERIEEISRFFHFVMLKLTFIGIVLPALLTTVVNYFINDMGSESYLLPSPSMYVSMKSVLKVHGSSVIFSCPKAEDQTQIKPYLSIKIIVKVACDSLVEIKRLV